MLLVTFQLFAILNPPSSVPTFLSLVGRGDERRRARLARMAGWLVFALMMAFALLGNYLLMALGVSLEALKLGGGLLLLALSLQMILSSKDDEVGGEEDVVPVATPLLVGPGTVTTLVILSAYHPIHVLLVAVALASALAYVCLRFSTALVGLLGETGIKAISRLMAVLMAAMAAEMIHEALLAWGIAKN